jgi:hypothetical protein
MIELEAVDDSFVDQASPDENYGSGPAFSTLWVWPAAREAVAYLKFDLSALRPDAVITHARLYLYQTRGAGFAPIGTRAYRLEDDAWSEDTLTFANQPWVFGAPLPLLGFNPEDLRRRGVLLALPGTIALRREPLAP